MTKTFDITDDLKLIEERILEMKAKQKAAIGEMIIATGAEKILSSNQLSGLVLCGIDRQKRTPPSPRNGRSATPLTFAGNPNLAPEQPVAVAGATLSRQASKPGNGRCDASGKAPDLLSRAQTA